MLNILKELITQKRVLILGFGREGRSTLHRLLQAGGYAALAIADQADISSAVKDPSIQILSGPSYLDALDDYDLVFKSPGIVLPKDPSQYRCQITSQMEVFFLAHKKQIIGITGTKGKSTVTTLLYHILKESGRDTVLAGNIGIPAFDILEEIKADTRIICELSCHQLEYIHVSPHVAVLLNIHEEHLDHYKTMKNYIHAKQQIYLHQEPEDLLLCDLSSLPSKNYCRSQIYTVSDCFSTADVLLSGTRIRFEQGDFRIPAKEISLLGHHNHIDIAFDYAICHMLGLSDEEFEAALRTYEPLPHRLRYIGEREGVRFYDDSISTIGDTAIQALKSVPNVGSILIGGMDRGIEYDDLITYLSRDPVPHIILMADTGKRIYQEIQDRYPDFHGRERLLLVDTLKDAVTAAKTLTAPGTACVLSPAAASYGIFKNFEERGDVFRDLALNYQ